MTAEEVKKKLDVALLSPIATAKEVEEHAKLLVKDGYYYCCVNSLHTRRAANILKGTSVKVVCSVGFPLGAVKTVVKCLETEQAVADGAGEIDMVMQLGALVGGDFKTAEDDIKAVVKAAAGLPVKVIIETPYLSKAQKVDACKIIQSAGGSFVKTCTGCSPDPIALYEDIRLIRQTVGAKMGIKASGRVGNYFRFTSMLEAGATRVGLALAQACEILQGCEFE